MDLSFFDSLADELSALSGGTAAGAGKQTVLTAEQFDGANASDVIEKALESCAHLIVPSLPYPLILDRPIVLSSGKRLSVAPDTVIRIREGCGGCMVRSAHLLSGITSEIRPDYRDRDILVEGGIWEGGKMEVAVNDPDPVMRSFGHGECGVFFFDNAERFTVRKVTVKESGIYAFLINACRDFVIEDVFFDHQHKDGVHVNGPASDGVIRRMHGNTGDDFVALNAWDWNGSAVSFGYIRRILVEDLHCEGDELRLLPGRKCYPDGSKTPCPISDCIFRRVTGAYCIKLYQQPNCCNDLTGENDRSDIAGEIENVLFSDIGLDKLTEEGFGEIGVTALFEVIADCRNICFDNVRVNVSKDSFRAAGMRLCEVGAKSSTWKHGSSDPATWCELFDVDLICTAEGMHFRDIYFVEEKCTDRDTLIGAHRLHPNPDYPNTLPKGGTGYGILGEITIE